MSGNQLNYVALWCEWVRLRGTSRRPRRERLRRAPAALTHCFWHLFIQLVCSYILTYTYTMYNDLFPRHTFYRLREYRVSIYTGRCKTPALQKQRNVSTPCLMIAGKYKLTGPMWRWLLEWNEGFVQYVMWILYFGSVVWWKYARGCG